MMPKQPPPWHQPPPRTQPSTKLTAAWKKRAEARARAAGRRYPNLVDNMWAAKQQRTTRPSRAPGR